MGTDGSGPDFFVSYTQADRAWAEWIAWVLEEDGNRVLVQAWDFVPGSNWVTGMQAGVTGAARTIAVLSPDYLESQYGTAEWAAAWASDPLGRERKLLTVRVRECERPGLLGTVVGVDLFALAEAGARARLRAMASSAAAGRAKPADPPPYPGAGGGRAVPREPRFPGALPRVWKVPARNPNFTGREADLAALRAALASGGQAVVQALRGMGGVGKTQLATEFAHARAADYDLVYWINAEEPATIPDQFTDLAPRLGLDPAADPAALQDQVHAELQGIPGWLLVFDNADQASDIRPWLPGGPLPPGIPGHVIVTTRRAGFTALGQVLELDVLDLASAVALLRTRVPDLDEGTGRLIAEELGRLPLALEQAAAYLDRTAMSAGDYLGLLRRRAAELFGRGTVSGREETVATLWDITLERIGATDPAAVILLELCAYLAPEPVPLDLFTGHPELLPGPLAAAAGDELAFSEAVAVLVDYSLAKRTPAGLQLHRLVQAVIRARLSAMHPGPGSPGPLVATGEAGEPRGTARLGTVLSLLQADAPGTITDVPQDWPRWAALLPSVLTAASHFDRLPSSPKEAFRDHAAWLLDRAATYLQVHARLAEARPLAERALAITEAAHGPGHPEVAILLGNLAVILRDLGEFALARPLVERAVAIDEAAYGPDHPDVAILLAVLAAILRDLGEPAGARPLAERALAISEAAHSPAHPTVAVLKSDLAIILLDLGEPAQARPLAERALDIDEAVYGPDHPAIATRLINLAAILRHLGDLAGARPLAERALDIDEAAYGPDHPEVAADLSNLAMILRDLGDVERARSLAGRAVAIDEAAYGPHHPVVETLRANLARMVADPGVEQPRGRREEDAVDGT